MASWDKGGKSKQDDPFDVVRRSQEASSPTRQSGVQFGRGRKPDEDTGLSGARKRFLKMQGKQASAPQADAAAHVAGMFSLGGGSSPGWGQRASSNDPKGLVRQLAEARGWTGAQWQALEDLVQRESSWNPTAQNPSSSAYGLFQFLDSTRKNYGITRESPLEAQIQAGLQYIQDRYQNPVGALNHWLARKPINGRDMGHWY